MVETEEKKTADKTETKKIQAALMADIRIIILKTRIHPAPAIAPTPIFPALSPVPIFTSFTERKEYSRSYLHIMESKKNSTVVLTNSG